MNLSEVLPKENLVLRFSDTPELMLRSIRESDGEILRTWKNSNREYFFHHDVIGPAEQEKWMASYLERTNDFMFMVLYHDEPIGCMGFRLQEDVADIYNVILGEPRHGGQGHMSTAFRELCRYAGRFRTYIELKVLKVNPAKTWYERNGFQISAEKDNYFLLTLDPARLQNLSFHEENI